ncbi:MAG: glycosyltransferase 87 family protein [Actinomycetota bacterium]
MTRPARERQREHCVREEAALGFLGLLAFVSFLLVRPFFDAASAYRPRPAGTTYAYSFLVLAAFVPYLLAVRPSSRPVSIASAITGAAVLHLVLLPAPLTQSQDLYSYLFYGKMWAVHGANPYVDLPQAFGSDPWFAFVRWPDQPSVYGPVWTLLSGAIARISGGSVAVAFGLTKTLVGLLLLASVAGLARAARDRDLDPGATVVLFAWNPLVLTSVSLGGHADIAVACGVVWAALADRRGKPLIAAILLSLATLVKAYAGLALIVYLLVLLRRRGPALRAGALAGGMMALAHAPFWAGLDTFSGLIRVAGMSSASLAGSLESMLAIPLNGSVAGLIVRALGVVVLATVVLRTTLTRRGDVDPWKAAAVAFATYVAVTPWFLYWHLVGPLALGVFAAERGVRDGLLTFSGTALLTVSGGTVAGRAMQSLLRYGVPALAALPSLHRHREASA